MTVHPLLPILLNAAQGVFPTADGEVEFVPSIGPGYDAVVSFTAHAYIATSMLPADVADLALDGYGGALQPDVLLRLGGDGPRFGSLDVLLVALGIGGGSLPERFDLDDHPRVRHARALRTDVRVFEDERGLITLSTGLAGRPELSIELPVGSESQGHGRALIAEALALAPAGQPLFAAVAAGNSRSLRAFLATGFTPIASELHIWRSDHH